MILTNQQFAHSEIGVRETGFMSLIHSLGYADTLRFIIQLSPGQGDYLQIQAELFQGATVDEIYAQARDYWERTKDN